MIALTSLSTDPKKYDRQSACIRSWQRAGVTEVVSINSCGDVQLLSSRYKIRFIICGMVGGVGDYWDRPLIPISELLWHANQLVAHSSVLIVNADYELDVDKKQLRVFAKRSKDGLGYLLQYNDAQRTVIESCGISAFLMHAPLPIIESKILVFGKPWWDYLLPWLAVEKQSKKLYASKMPAGYHEHHSGRWNGGDWEITSKEFASMLNFEHPVDGAKRSALSASMRKLIEDNTAYI